MPIESESARRTPTSREDVARVELGGTVVSPHVARALVVAFAVCIAVVPFVQVITEVVGDGRIRLAELVDRWPTQRALHDYEVALDDGSWLGRAAREPVQQTLLAFGAGNEQVYVGRDGWAFFAPAVDHVTGRGFLDGGEQRRRRLGGEAWAGPPVPDPIAAIVGFRDQLAARDIDLVVVPAPSKVQVRADRLTGNASDRERMLANRSWLDVLERLTAAGIGVFDPVSILDPAVGAVAGERYLATDSHWRPEVVVELARQLAAAIDRHRLGDEEVAWGVRSTVVENRGDVARMLGAADPFPPESVAIEIVERADGGEPWSARRGAPVLLLGDSFSNIYSAESMGWGSGAGLAEHLARWLRRDVDRIVRNDDGAFATRLELARQLVRDPARLDGVRVVVWEFASRELSFGDWRTIDMPAPTAPAARPSGPVLEAGELRIVGTVAELARPPRPGSVPYRDCIVGLHITDVAPAGDGPAELPEELLLYAWGMRDNVWTAVARLARAGRIEAVVRPWADVEAELGSQQRSEPDDDMVLLLDPFWAVTIEAR